jgi:hypothetical protein
MNQLQKEVMAPQLLVEVPNQDDLQLKAVAAQAGAMAQKLERPGFKTPQELGLTQLQFDSLVKVLELIENGRLKHGLFEESPRGHTFNMTNWVVQHECGTIACLAGSAELIAGYPKASNKRVFQGPVPDGTEIGKLFYCGATSRKDWSRCVEKARFVSETQAAVVLRGYLETGKADWSSVMGG